MVKLVEREIFPDADRATVMATQAIANVVKSSFGPSGLDKMMVDDIGVSISTGSAQTVWS